ncbi:hypothetical protein [Methylobacterium indicum]|nr:hypothetical protein [Methylobacterium indicum]
MAFPKDAIDRNRFCFSAAGASLRRAEPNRRTSTMTTYNDVDSALKSFEMVGFSYHNFKNRTGHLKRIVDLAPESAPARVEAVPEGPSPEIAAIVVPHAVAVEPTRHAPVEALMRDEPPAPAPSPPAILPLPEAGRSPLTLEHVFRLLSSPEPH